jgi:hypothetical protein
VLEGLKDTKKNKKCIVFELDLDDKIGLMTWESNENIDKLCSLYENRQFEETINDVQLYNEAMELAQELPLFNLSFKDEHQKQYIRKYGLYYRKAFENYLVGKLRIFEEDDKKEKSVERGEIKFTIWKEPDKKVTWLEDNEPYQKIEYVFEDEDKGIKIDFLLGQDDTQKWHLWCGKPGSCSYDDDPYCEFDTSKFSEAIVQALDKVDEIIGKVKEDPHNFVQFYVHL